MMEYKIVMADHQIDLEKYIRDLISIGYKPQGGIAVVLDSSGFSSQKKFYQAVVRTK